MRIPDYVLSPLGWAVLFAFVLVLLWRRLPRVIRIAGIALELMLLIAMAPLGANLLVWSVESQAPTPQACPSPAPSTIVLLSGGTSRQPRSPEDVSALDTASLHRLFAGISLWRNTPDGHLVISGGGRRVPESVLLAGLAEHMGVPRDVIRLEQHSHTTWENALYTARLSPAVPQRIWLVTSALHMPRALGAFRAVGFQPCAWPSDSLHEAFSPRIGYFLPQSSSLAKTDAAIHELVGGAVYRAIEWKHQRDDGKQPLDAAKPAPSSPIAGASANP